jgi:hypothetical protein
MSVRPLIALLLGVTVALAVGCGDRSALLSNADAVGLKDELSSVQSALDDGNCVEATRAAGRFRRAADNLQTSIDPKLRERIRQGAADLFSQAATDCRSQKTVTTETTTIETTPTTTTPTTPTTTTPTAPTITTPIPTTPTTPGGTGGAGAGGGGGGTP